MSEKKGKIKITCDVHKGNKREWEISSDHRVWPCCLYANAWQLIDDKGSTLAQDFKHDYILQKKFRQDPDWNNLKKKSLDEILQDPIMTEYIYKDGWNHDVHQPKICARECGEYFDEVTGKTTTKARLD